MNKLEQLRERYEKTSSNDERLSIIKEAKLLKGELFQCYFTSENKRCENYQEDCWCSPEHKKAWQDSNYGIGRHKSVRKLTIAEMQAELKNMAIQERLKRHKNTS